MVIFLVLGIFVTLSGFFLMRLGRVMKSKEIEFGAVGLVFGGIFLVFLALAILLTNRG